MWVKILKYWTQYWAKPGGLFSGWSLFIVGGKVSRIHWSGSSVGEMKNSFPCMDLHLDLAARRWLFYWLNISTVTMFIPS